MLLPGRLTAGLAVYPPVTGNRSLDEFGATEPSPESPDPEPGTTTETAETDASGRTTDDPAAAETSTPTDGVEPVESTYDWTPGGAPCAVCGESVEERWRDADGLVCLECKVW